MSIRSFNKLTSYKGCIPIISLVLLITMIFSFSGRGCQGGPNSQNPDQEAQDKVVATVGEYPITDSRIHSLYDQQVKQYARFLGDKPIPASVEMTLYGGVLSGEIRNGLALVEAKNQHIPITDADINKDAQQQIDQEILHYREQLIQGKQLKADANDKEFDAAFKAVKGQTASEYRKTMVDGISTALRNPNVRPMLAAQVAQTLVPKVLATRLTPSVEELKASYSGISVKQLALRGPDMKELPKVQADLKGGESFETVIDRYSKEKPPKGKKASEVETTLTHDELSTPALAPLLKLKPGEVSGPIGTPTATTFYKVIKATSNLPKDFEKNKQALLAQYAETLAQKQFGAEIEALKKKTPISWKDSAWHTFYDYFTISENPPTSPAELDQKRAVLLDEALKGEHSLPLALTAYVDSQALASTAAPKDKAAADAKEITAIKAMEEFAPGADLQLQLAGAYAQEKDPAGLAEALTTAASQNTDFTETGKAIYGQIETMLHANDKLLTPEGKKSVEAAQLAWQTGKADQDKEQAAQVKAAADQAKQEALEKKNYERAQKEQAEKEKKAAPAPPSTKKQ